MTEAIEIPFVVLTHVEPRNHVRDGESRSDEPIRRHEG